MLIRCSLLLALCAPLSAMGQEPEVAPPADSVAVTPSAPSEPRGAFGTYGERLELGLEQIGQGDSEGALATLDEAEKLSPASPLVHCYRGAAHLASARWEDATRAYGVCRTLAKQVKDKHALEVALVGLARVIEAKGDDVDAARVAYANVVKEAESTLAKTLGAAKVKAYMERAERLAQAAAVRERAAKKRLSESAATGL